MTPTDYTNWKALIEKAARGDTITHCTLKDYQLTEMFDHGPGGANGAPFTAWSDEYVYFPVTYDGYEWVERVPRHPDTMTPTEHVGGQ